MTEGKDVSINSKSASYIEHLHPEMPDAPTAIDVAASDLRAWKSVYELCIELRNFEITQLVQRNNFFMIFQGVLLAGICQSAGQIPIVSFMICLVGLSVSLCQAGMAAGAKYWQVHWELSTKLSESWVTQMYKVHSRLGHAIKEGDVEVDPLVMSKIERRRVLVHLFQDDSRSREEIKKELGRNWVKRRFVNYLIMRRFSASRIPIYVGMLLALAWFLLLVCTIKIPGLDWHVLDIVTGFPVKLGK
ncbi:hypothetical protein ABKS89_25110 [Pseudomonas sp. LABIM340]|uniref:RipA family octameric membrane protein n=1 Tax=Pseudomonas sp. LABIM340 TaxID=3156585 RepID=UPI0032AE86E4